MIAIITLGALVLLFGFYVSHKRDLICIAIGIIMQGIGYFSLGYGFKHLIFS